MKFDIVHELKNKSGIYQIKCIITNEIYIGATSNFKKRFSDHIYEIKNRGRCFSLKQHAVLHGIDNFVFSLLEMTDNLKYRKIYYIKLLQPTLNVFLTDSNTFINYKNGCLKGSKKKPYKRKKLTIN